MKAIYRQPQHFWDINGSSKRFHLTHANFQSCLQYMYILHITFNFIRGHRCSETGSHCAIGTLRLQHNKQKITNLEPCP